MRYGVISDVHANVHALESVLHALEREGVDRILCAGDLVGYGPHPNECVARIASLEPSPLVVSGNHDLMAVGRLPTDDIGPLPRLTIDWTIDVLEHDARRYLEGLPPTAITDGGDAVVAHGTLDDPVEYVFDATAAREQLALLGERHRDARVLVLGHTHRPQAVTGYAAPAPEGELDLGLPRWVLNAGAVGQSRERRALARALVLDLERRSARFLAIEYDVRATERDLRAAGLPEHACHLAPGRTARVRRKLKAALTT
jgi:predicted phosphodiesterase